MVLKKENVVPDSTTELQNEYISIELDRILNIQKKYIGGDMHDNCRKISDNCRKNAKNTCSRAEERV